MKVVAEMVMAAFEGYSDALFAQIPFDWNWAEAWEKIQRIKRTVEEDPEAQECLRRLVERRRELRTTPWLSAGAGRLIEESGVARQKPRLVCEEESEFLSHDPLARTLAGRLWARVNSRFDSSLDLDKELRRLDPDLGASRMLKAVRDALLPSKSGSPLGEINEFLGTDVVAAKLMDAEVEALKNEAWQGPLERLEARAARGTRLEELVLREQAFSKFGPGVSRY